MKKYILYIALALIAAGGFTLQKGNAEEDRADKQASSTETTETKDVSAETKDAPSGSKRSKSADYELPAPLKGVPEQIIKHTGFTLSYNNKHNTPNWSAWTLTRKKAEGTLDRGTKFWADPEIATPYRVDYYDYKGSGYDRGHMCPAGDMKWSSDAMHDCFYMSNMCPQDPSLNSGSWKKLEEACRQWVATEGTLYIICGPVYEKKKKHEQIGIDHAIDVPEGFFKAVLSLRKGKEKAIGFYYSNTSSRQSMSKTAMSVDELEKKTGIDFFPALDDSLEDRLESSCDIKAWK